MEDTVAIRPTFNSSLAVFAEMVSEERLARQNYYLKRKSGNVKQKEEALDELRAASDKVTQHLHVILNKPHAQQRRQPAGDTGQVLHRVV